MKARTLLVITLVLLLISTGLIGWLLVSRQNQLEEFTVLQNQYVETKLELDRLQQVIGEEVLADIYFPKDRTSSSEPTELFPLQRRVSAQDKVAGIIGSYIVGITATELEQGYYLPSGDFEITNYQRLDLRGESNCEGKDFTVSTENSIVTVKFCKALMQSGVLADARVKSAMERSIKEATETEKVIFLNRDGDCMFDESGMNICLED